MEIKPAQLVAYLLSNIDDLLETFGCKESDLKKALQILNVAPDLLEALKGLFENCEMIHKYWGANCNQKEANNAVINAKAAIAKAEKG